MAQRCTGRTDRKFLAGHAAETIRSAQVVGKPVRQAAQDSIPARESGFSAGLPGAAQADDNQAEAADAGGDPLTRSHEIDLSLEGLQHGPTVKDSSQSIAVGQKLDFVFKPRLDRNNPFTGT
jgi:hypothetical protein